MSADGAGNIWLAAILIVNLAVAGVVIYIVYLLIRALRKYLRS
jgi:hypothetical protein